PTTTTRHRADVATCDAHGPSGDDHERSVAPPDPQPGPLAQHRPLLVFLARTPTTAAPPPTVLEQAPRVARLAPGTAHRRPRWLPRRLRTGVAHYRRRGPGWPAAAPASTYPHPTEFSLRTPLRIPISARKRATRRGQAECECRCKAGPVQPRLSVSLQRPLTRVRR
ncbi:hypothetical protein BDV93DRAFT_475897, partial [Ceratobasidium sp. AG-I]